MWLFWCRLQSMKTDREVLDAAEGMQEDKASWGRPFQWLRGRGLDGVKLVVGNKCFGMLEAVGEVFPEAKCQRCTVHFYRNVFSITLRSEVKLVAKMLKVIHARESKKAVGEKTKAVVGELRAIKPHTLDRSSSFMHRWTAPSLKVWGSAKILGLGPVNFRLASSKASSKVARVLRPMPRAMPGS